jgi:GT2 family glycosyltransferase
MKKQSELLRALQKELAAKEKELADQKWVFEQFLKSPSWRWTAPIRWAVNQLRGLRNGSAAGTSKSLSDPEPLEDTESIADAGGDVKAAFTSLCYVGLETFLASGATLHLPESSKPVISIVLVLFNRAELTLACLRSIAEHQNEEIEVVIVDNASSDQTSHLLDRLKGARIIRNSENRHFLAGVNQATTECRGEYILLLNNDAQLLPGALQSALGTLRSSADIGAVGGRIILLDGTLQEAGSVIWQNGSCSGYGRGDDPSAPMYCFRRDVDYCSGAFLLTPRKTWEKLGGFDTVFAPAYYEETDYCMRLWAQGLRVVYEPGAAITHYEFGSSKSATAANLQARHQTLFAERHRGALAGREQASPEALLRARSRNADRRILFIDDRVPHLWLGSGFPRANALIRSLLKQGYFVTLYPMATIPEAWDAAYADFPSEVEIMMGMGREFLRPFLRNRRDYYSAIIVSRPHNMKWLTPLLNAHSDWFENVHLIYDAEALFAARDIGLRRLAGNPMTDEEILNAFESEVRLTKAADQVVAVSQSERETFRRHGIDRVEILGHSLETTPGQASFDSRSGLLFVGAIHEDSPNADSLIWFLKDVYPRICRQLGQVPMTIAGVNQSEAVRALAEPSVRITGHLPSLQGLYSESRVFIAPTRYAAGIPHKVHEAAAYGLPVVATPLLAEQLDWSEREIAIAGDAEAFAARCVEIYTNSEEWNRLREAALERVRRECSPQAFEENLRRILSNSS